MAARTPNPADIRSDNSSEGAVESPLFNYHSINEDEDELSSTFRNSGLLPAVNDAPYEVSETRRSVISAVDVEAMQAADFPDAGQSFDKTPGEIEQLIPHIKSVVLFEGYDNDELMLVAQHMYNRSVRQGEVVIEYGSTGNAVYVVKSGKYRCTVPDASGTHVAVRSYNGEGHFGELALLNHTPRAATITATTDGELWALDAFRNAWLRKNRAISNAGRMEQVIQAIPLFRENLSPCLTNRLIDAIDVVNLASGDVICRQGEPGDAMYFIMEGEVEVCIDQNPVKRMSKNEFFGERALVLDEGRAATCRALSKLKLAKLAKESFGLVMPDSVVENMRKHIATNYIMASVAAQNTSEVVNTGTETFLSE